MQAEVLRIGQVRDGFVRLIFFFLVVITGFVLTPGSAQAQRKTPSDLLGTIKSSHTTTCPSGGVGGATCYKLVISCPDVANMNAVLKVNRPTGSSLGTIIFGAGGDGFGYYDQMFTYGSTAVSSVLSAGFTVAQINFNGSSAGWMTGPGGPRKLACRMPPSRSGFTITSGQVLPRLYAPPATAAVRQQ
jgi:hypothetical protein